MQKQRKPIRIVQHLMLIDGKLVPVDPIKTDLPDRCKLALAEMVTGQKWELTGAK